MTITTYVVLVVEDELSAAVMGRLINGINCDLAIDRTINTRGCGDMKKGMEKWRNGSKGIPHILLTDLDNYKCPLHLISDWGAENLPAELLFRVAVKEVEAWLLGDSSGIADFLGVAKNKIPLQPEYEKDPKGCILGLARKSRKKRLAAELVPETGSAARIGPYYNVRLIEFVSKSWNVDDARKCVPSLDRACTRLAEFLVV